jgi:hypothetical protein
LKGRQETAGFREESLARCSTGSKGGEFEDALKFMKHIGWTDVGHPQFEESETILAFVLVEIRGASRSRDCLKKF